MSTSDEVLAIVSALVETTPSPDPHERLELVAAALEAWDIPILRKLPLAGHGQADATIDLFVHPGLAVLLDTGDRPDLDRIQRCTSPPAVTAVAVLTTANASAFPTGHTLQMLTHGKRCVLHRVGGTAAAHSRAGTTN